MMHGHTYIKLITELYGLIIWI